MARNTANTTTKSAVLEDAPEPEVEDANAARQADAATAPEAEEASGTESVQKKKNRLRNEAEREVLDAHKDEFYAIADRKFRDAGLKFERRLSEKEKAAKKMQALLLEYPDLRSEFENETPEASA